MHFQTGSSGPSALSLVTRAARYAIARARVKRPNLSGQNDRDAVNCLDDVTIDTLDDADIAPSASCACTCVQRPSNRARQNTDPKDSSKEDSLAPHRMAHTAS
jgi:hypothetical protein